MMILVLFVFLLFGIYLIYREVGIHRAEKYFADRGIIFQRPEFFLWKLKNILTGNVAEILDKLYKKHETQRIIGWFDMGIPCYFIRDPAMAKQVMIKGFEHFTDHLFFIDADMDPLFGNSLIALRGKRWKSMRTALSPMFTGSKMRQMFQLVQQCSNDTTNFLLEQSKSLGPQVYDMKDLYSKFTNDVIATCAFGVKCDTFQNPENDFFKTGQKMLNFLSPYNMFKMLIYNSFQSKIFGKLFNVKLIDDNCQKTFRDIIVTNMRIREEKGIVRPDMINLLMQLKKGQLKSVSEVEANKSIATAENHISSVASDSKLILTDDLLIPQCFIFFFAGFDTSSTLMTFAAYELATNPEVQQKLVEEIDATNDDLDGKPLDYDHLQSMSYLDMVISETLRKWPPLAVVDRRCNAAYASEKESDFELKIDKKSLVIVSIYSLHRDPKHFPDPEKFYPERFSEENKSLMNWDAYVPFGIGPRNCIGSRFALMQVKSIIYHLLLIFTFEVCETTQIPVKLRNTMFGVIPKTVELRLKPRDRI